jgi:hypothetical protein
MISALIWGSYDAGIEDFVSAEKNAHCTVISRRVEKFKLNCSRLPGFLCVVFFTLAILDPLPSYSQNRYDLDKDVGIKTIYLSNGNSITCGKTWFGNETIYCHKYGGTVGIPLKQLDLQKTLEGMSDQAKKRFKAMVKSQRSSTESAKR